MSNLAYGTFTITNLSAVTSVDVYYYNSTSSSSLSGGSWSTDAPTWTNGRYIWSKTVTTWEQGVTTESEPVCITGQKGSTGAAGQSVTRITQQYALSTNSTTAPTTGWTTTMPTFESGKFYWTRSEIVWANPTGTTYTTAVLANGITSANTTAAVANTNAQSAISTANTANQTANTANQTANAANQTAQNAVSVANGKNAIYYSSTQPTGGTYKAGDTWFYLTNDGYRIYEYNTTSNDWVQKSMDGKSITAGTVTAAQIQAGAITAEKITTENVIGSGGWINLRNGTFNYSDSTTGQGISWDGDNLSINASTINIGTTNVLTSINNNSTAIGNVQTLVRQYRDGVLVAKTGNNIGALVNANGSFDIVTLTWSDTTPTTENVLASFGENTEIGNFSGINQQITSNGINFKNGNDVLSYISLDKFYSINSEVQDALYIGNYSLRNASDGKLVIGRRK